MGWAKRRTTSKGSAKPVAAALATASSSASSSCSPALAGAGLWFSAMGVVDLSASEQSKKTTHPRWTPLAPLQETMEGRAHLRMVG